MLSSLTLNGLQLLGSSAFALHEPVEGLEAPVFRLSEYDKPGEDGGVLAAAYYGPRAITLNGLVRGDSAAAYEASRRELQTACAISKDATGFPQLAVLSFTTSGGSSYFINVQVRKAIIPIGRGMSAKFQIQLVAPDPRLYIASQQSTGLISAPSGGGFTVPFVLPVTFAPSSGGSGTANNTGNILTYPVLTLRGQLTNPYIQNATTGKFLQLNRVVAGGETVVIDMADKTILLGTTSLLISKATGSDWWGLQAGNNSIALSTGSSGDTGTVELTWYSAVLGV